MKKKLFFLAHFLRNPKSVGALSALNKHVAKSLLSYLSNRDLNKTARILEVGAGTGSITKEIIDRLNPGDKLDVIEIDPDCCELLVEKFGDNPAVKVKCCSITEWKPNYKYDFIISTLPFNSFSVDFIKNIMDHYLTIGTKDCICTYVEYIGLQDLDFIFSKADNRNQIIERKDLLKNYQRQFLINKSDVFLNFLPCHVYHMKFS